MNYVVIVAGGKGTRMGADLPKQFLPIGDRPVLMHTISCFHAYDPKMEIIIVLPAEQQHLWHDLCEQHDFRIPHRVADGGSTRFESSKTGLACIPADAEGLVAFHDGVRPFVSPEVIRRCFEAAQDDYAAIPVMPVTDTLRYVDRGQSNNVQRDFFRVVQTPQVFDLSLARQAFNQPCRDTFTDDASVVESLGCRVTMVEGARENIKLTTPFDLQLADFLIRQG